MQELKKKWNKKDTVKKVTVIAGIFFVFLMAFFSAFGILHVSALTPAIVQEEACSNCSIINYPIDVTSGNMLVIAWDQISGSTCNSAPTDSLSNSFLKLWGTANVGFTGNYVCVYWITTTGGADSVTLPAQENTAIIFELFDFTINGTQAIDGGSTCSSGCAATIDYHASSSFVGATLNVELMVAGTAYSYNGTLTDTSGYTSGANYVPGMGNTNYPASANAFAFGLGGNQNFPVTFGNYANGAHDQDPISYSVYGFSLGSISPYSPYSTFTSSYSYTVTYSVCPSGNVSGTCTQTSGTTVIHYDNTSTTVITSGCDNDPTCATYSNSTTVVVTYTASSIILVTDTTTITRTNTAINAPTGFQLQFWLVPLIFLMGPAFGFMGAYGAAVQERGGSVNGNNAVLLFLLGLNIGAIGGIILKVMPFPVLVVTMIPLVLLLYSMR